MAALSNTRLSTDLLKPTTTGNEVRACIWLDRDELRVSVEEQCDCIMHNEISRFRQTNSNGMACSSDKWHLHCILTPRPTPLLSGLSPMTSRQLPVSTQSFRVKIKKSIPIEAININSTVSKNCLAYMQDDSTYWNSGTKRLSSTLKSKTEIVIHYLIHSKLIWFSSSS